MYQINIDYIEKKQFFNVILSVKENCTNPKKEPTLYLIPSNNKYQITEFLPEKTTKMKQNYDILQISKLSIDNSTVIVMLKYNWSRTIQYNQQQKSIHDDSNNQQTELVKIYAFDI